MDLLNNYFERFVQHLKLYLIYSNQAKQALQDTFTILELYQEARFTASDLLISPKFFDGLHVKFIEAVLRVMHAEAQLSQIIVRLQSYLYHCQEEVRTLNSAKIKQQMSSYLTLFQNANHKKLADSYLCYRHLISYQYRFNRFGNQKGLRD